MIFLIHNTEREAQTDSTWRMPVDTSKNQGLCCKWHSLRYQLNGSDVSARIGIAIAKLQLSCFQRRGEGHGKALVRTGCGRSIMRFYFFGFSFSTSKLSTYVAGAIAFFLLSLQYSRVSISVIDMIFRKEVQERVHMARRTFH